MPEQAGPSRQTLEEVPGRAFIFVIAVAETPAISAALTTKGYSEQEHQYAWARLTRLAVVTPTPSTTTLDRPVRDAVVELDNWDEPNFACIKATLTRLHPEQAKFVFNDLEPKQGREAVLSVSTLLDRLDALESSPDRQGTRAADLAALETLATRGYTKAERDRLRALVNLAQRVVLTPPPSTDEREQILRDLHAWLTDWATAARTVITRRDYLIRLGLAKRRKRSPEAGGGEGGAGGGNT